MYATSNQPTSSPTDAQLSAGVARLRAERDALKDTPAVHAGRAWAVSHARYVELRNWKSWTALRKPPLPGTREVLSHVAAWAADPGLRLDDVGEFAKKIFLQYGGLTVDESNSNILIQQFVAGALQVLAETDADVANESSS